MRIGRLRIDVVVEAGAVQLQQILVVLPAIDADVRGRISPMRLDEAKAESSNCTFGLIRSNVPMSPLPVTWSSI